MREQTASASLTAMAGNVLTCSSTTSAPAPLGFEARSIAGSRCPTMALRANQNMNVMMWPIVKAKMGPGYLRGGPGGDSPQADTATASAVR